MPQPSIIKIRLKITYLKFQSNFPGANELIITIDIEITSNTIHMQEPHGVSVADFDSKILGCDWKFFLGGWNNEC